MSNAKRAMKAGMRGDVLRRVRCGVFAASMLFACASCAPTQPAMEPLPADFVEVSLLMRFRGAEPAIEVMVNGQGPFLFALDTGADDLLRVDSSLVDRLGLRRTGTEATGDLSGRQATLNTVQIDSLAVGPIRFSNIAALSRNYNRMENLPRIDGILCLDLFARFLLTLDYPAKQIRLGYGELAPPDGENILPLKSTHGLPSIDLLVGKSKVNALIDSGNLVPGFLLPGSLEHELTFASDPVPFGTIRTVAGEIAAQKARLNQTIQFGGHRFVEPMVVFPNFSDNASIGSDVLSRFAITFDQRNQRVRFEIAPTPPER